MGRIMANITVVNKYKCDDPDAVYIGRGSPLGNPYPISTTLSRELVIDLYKSWLRAKVSENDPKVMRALNQIAELAQRLEGVKLKCFCAPKPCHGDFIKEYVLKALA
jgi:hypothetical protein